VYKRSAGHARVVAAVTRLVKLENELLARLRQAVDRDGAMAGVATTG